MFGFIWGCMSMAIQATLGWVFIMILATVICMGIYGASMLIYYLKGLLSKGE
jgi:hypothetical protein